MIHGLTMEERGVAKEVVSLHFNLQDGAAEAAPKPLAWMGFPL